MGFERLRENVDGPGIRTLVLLGGCPLHCEYCLNKMLLRSGIQKAFTPDELYDILMVDSSSSRSRAEVSLSAAVSQPSTAASSGISTNLARRSTTSWTSALRRA